MANRSDFSSTLPRQIKRMLAMGQAKGYIPADNAGVVRRLFAAAHKEHKKARNKSLAMKRSDSDEVAAE